MKVVVVVGGAGGGAAFRKKQAAGDPETSSPLLQRPAARCDQREHLIADNYRLVVVQNTEHAPPTRSVSLHLRRSHELFIWNNATGSSERARAL